MHKTEIVAERFVQVSAITVTAAYLVTGIAYLCLDHWTVTQQDFWRVYDICLNHSWLQSALLKFNNHSLFFPSFIWQADLYFFTGNQSLIFVVGLFLLVGSTALLLLPICRDKTADLTAKLLATLILTATGFWMGRASITVSGGFDCITSLVVLGLAAALFLLPAVASEFYPSRNTLLVLCCGYLASFSFGTGLAIWPSLLLLGWCLRLSWRHLAVIALAGMMAGLLFCFLPSQEKADSFTYAGSFGSWVLENIGNICQLVGTPVFRSLMAWRGIKVTPAMIQSSYMLLWLGGFGVSCAILFALLESFKRDSRRSALSRAGLGLTIFNLMAFFLIAIGRSQYFATMPESLAAPRFQFWSSLFWAGLILMALEFSKKQCWMRWGCIVIALAAPIFGWQEHRDEGLHWRYARFLSAQAAMSLINEVHDPQRMLFRKQEQIDTVAPQLRARRLDMFAQGWQDWIGRPADEIFGERRTQRRFRGDAYLDRIPGLPSSSHARRIRGQAYEGNEPVSSPMIIVTKKGIVAGVAGSFPTGKWTNLLLFHGKMPRAPVFGYIREYDPERQYALRSVGDRGMSQQEIPLAAPRE